jgi:uncharacterized protein YlxP (DUF503 family)
MIVGVCKVTLRIPESQSLKGKRRAISSLSARLRGKFNVSVAEVGDNDVWQSATLGITCASNSSRHVDEVLSGVLDFIERTGEDLEVVGQDIETMSGF